MIRGDVGEFDYFLNQPLAETGCQQDHAIGGAGCVAFRDHPIRKRIEPSCQGTVPPSRTNKWIAGGMLPIELPSPLRATNGVRNMS